MKRHLIGIGGVGMSALATALVKLGDTVTGADRTRDTPNIRRLHKLGVRVYPDDGRGIDAKTDEVIVSTAIEETNRGLLRARKRGIPVTHRAVALARTLADRKLVAVVGTCGKSTVTAMLGHVLAACGLDPFCVNGANVPGWDGAVRFGAGEYAVAEVDESDKSLVAFKPYAVIVTNASADHYSKEEMDAVFDAFIKDVPGPLVDGRVLDPRAPAEVETSMPGAHNRRNAALALRMACALGCDEKKARAALLDFPGVERRFQRIRPRRPSPPPSMPAVYDDYAHNPEKLRAMLTALQERHPKGVCAIWRPHGYTPLRKMLDALADMFTETLRAQDTLILLPIYDAGGTTDRSIDTCDLMQALHRRKDDVAAENVFLVSSYELALGLCLGRRQRVDAFVVCGARDPGLPGLAQSLADSLADALMASGRP